MNATTGIGAAQKLITREQIAKPVALLMAPVNYGSEWREKERGASIASRHTSPLSCYCSFSLYINIVMPAHDGANVELTKGIPSR